MKIVNSKATVGNDINELAETDLELLTAISQQLQGYAKVGVAFSGGVDSAVLLAIASEVLGCANVKAFIGVSHSLAKRELELAISIAELLGVELIQVETNELQNEKYATNDENRCYFCKDALFSAIKLIDIKSHEIDVIAYGENLDDAERRDRPGSKAANEHGVIKPLASAGARKAAIRRIAKFYNLPVADKPATPCLASRVLPFTRVTEEKLYQIEIAEARIFALGYSDVRVRHLGEIASIELLEAELPNIKNAEKRNAVLMAVTGAGFKTAEISSKGLQSGSFSAKSIND